MHNKIKSIYPLAGLTLIADFENGEKRKYDVRPLLDKWEAFRSLQEVPGLFEQVQVDAGGYGISWNDDIDLSCDEIYYNGNPC